MASFWGKMSKQEKEKRKKKKKKTYKGKRSYFGMQAKSVMSK